MKATRVPIACISGILLLLTAVHAEQAWVKERISAGGSLYKGYAKVYQDKVYWTQESGQRSGSGDIYVWDRARGERPIIATSANEMVWAVCEDTLAITEYTNGQLDLFLWDPANGKRTISTAPGNQYEADLHGDLLVWEDHRNSISQVYMWDPMGGERPISPSPMDQSRPRVFSDTIVWNENDGAGRNDSYMWNPRDGTKKLSTYIYGMGYPEIWGDTVLMTLGQDHGLQDPFGIWEYKIGQGLMGPLVRYVNAYHIRMSERTIAWQTTPADPGSIDVWTPELGVARLSENGLHPDVYERTLAWEGADSSIWIAQFVPEPSSLLGLGSLLGLIALIRRRKAGC